MPRVMQRSFTGGVMSAHMMARSDDIKFQTGLKRCENFIVLPQGPVTNRAGLAYVNAVKDSNRKVRLIRFEYSADQTVILEFGHHYIRFHTQGQTILGSDGNPYEVETPYEEADLFDLHHIQSNDILTITHRSYPIKELRRYSMNDWRLVDVSFSPKLATPSGVKAERTSAADEDKNASKYTQKYRVTALNSDKTAESLPSPVASVVANLYATGTVVTISWDKVEGATFYRVYKNQGGVYGYIGDTEDLSIVDDNIAPEMDITPRRFDESFVSAKGITAVEVTAQGSGYIGKRDIVDYDRTGTYYYWNMDKLEYTQKVSIPTMIGDTRMQRYSVKVVDRGGNGSGAAAKMNYTVTETVQGLPYKVRLDGFTITNAGSNYVDPWIEVWYSGNYTHKDYEFQCVVNTADGGVTLDVSDATGSGAVLRPIVSDGKITAVQVVQGGTGYTNPTVRAISENGSGATFSVTVAEAGSYPRAVCYYEQRRCFGGLSGAPQRVLMTRSSTEDDMTYALPVQDDDRINIELAARDNNPILHMVPVVNLILLTPTSEWRVTTMNSDALTPESISVRQTSFVGANNVQPIVANSSMLYCASRGGHVREYGYNSDAGGYVSSDLSLRAADLFDSFEITDSTFTKAPHPMAWFVSTSGNLLGLTYVPEQQVGAWHVHSTDGVFESVACVPEGKEDALYAVVRRYINGKYVRQIERMTERSKGVFVDAAGVYEGAPTKVVSGLARLEGKTVSILADGAVENQQVVTDGKITLEREASRIVVGLPITSTIETLPMTITLRDNSTSSGRNKNVNEVWLRLVESSGVWAGPDEENLVEAKQRKDEPYGEPAEVITGEIAIRLKGKWTNDGEIVVRQLDPLPITIVGLTADVAVG